MKIVRTVCAALLAIPLLVFGANYFAQVIPPPPLDGTSGAELLVAMHDGGIMAAIAASHLIVGVMLLWPRLRTAGALLQLPMTLGILAFHVTMQPAGTLFSLGLVALNLAALADRRIASLVAPAPSVPDAAATHDASPAVA